MPKPKARTPQVTDLGATERRHRHRPDSALRPFAPFRWRSASLRQIEGLTRNLPRGRSPLRPLTCILAALLATPLGVSAQDDQDSARTALEQGQIVPLGEILDAARSLGSEQILEIELERRDGRWVYEVESLSADGVISRHYLDAATKARLPDGDAPDEPER